MPKVLIAEDEKIIRMVLEKELKSVGYEVTSVDNGQSAIDIIQQVTFDAVISDMKMPLKDGMDIIKAVKLKSKYTKVIIITAYASIEGAVGAMKLGADDYISKPFDNNVLIQSLNKLLLSREILSSKGILKDKETSIELLGDSPIIKDILNKIDKIKDLPTTVLITGESGTGKGVVARELHKRSNRNHLPFMQADCSSFNPNLIESELFGYEKGAFTSANKSKCGKFELAGDGFIFLDEIGNLSMDLQTKLLLVLQERAFYRVGGEKKHTMNARIVAATNINIEEAIANKTFREDLFYRLNVISIELPPLRYHKEDIPILANHFIEHFEKIQGKPKLITDETFWETLNRYDWPGNVRELENTLESAIALCDGNYLTKKDLPSRITMNTNRSNYIDQSSYINQSGNEVDELKELLSALDRFDGHREKTASYLGITRRALQYRLKKYNLTNRS